MIIDPNLIFYACIAKGSMIVAQFSRNEPGIESLAQKCIEKTPPFYSMFTHTVSKTTHTFLIDDRFVYFIISHKNLDKSESFWFLNRLKIGLEDFILTGLILGTDNLTSNCLQSNFNPWFTDLLALDSVNLEFVTSPVIDSRNPSMDSERGKGTMVAPMLGNQNKGLKKKKRSGGFEVNGGSDTAKYGGGAIGFGMANTFDESRDFSVSMQKSGAFGSGGGDRQKAKQSWRKHVWVILILDLIICATLFGIWLWVCRGFQCIDG